MPVILLPMSKVRTCKGCGRKFEGRHPRQLFCAPKCKTTFHQKNRWCKKYRENRQRKRLRKLLIMERHRLLKLARGGAGGAACGTIPPRRPPPHR
jgi:hypothetical protein